jgi:DNA-directed RNA polymerase specialized sigma24 family protein
MPPNSAGPGPGIAAFESAARIRAVLESDAEGLYRVLAVKVQKAFAHLRRDEVAERVYEVLDETARRALARPETLDPARSVFAWLVGIGIHVLLERVREVARDRRQVNGTDLGDDVWAALQGRLQRGPSEDALGDRIDLHEALGRLDPGSRHALECRFFRDLDGEGLAEALGAPSVGAARVRVSRALQRLRDQFGAEGPEVSR